MYRPGTPPVIEFDLRQSRTHRVVTSTVQAALDALPADGGSIFIPPGVYQEAVRVTKPNVTITGTWDSIIKTPDAATQLDNDAAVRVFADGCTIRDIKIDGNQEGNTQFDTSAKAREADGIAIYADNCLVDHCWVDNCLGHHVIVWNEAFADESHATGARTGNTVQNCLLTGVGLRNMLDFASTQELGEAFDTNINHHNQMLNNAVVGGNIVVHTGWDTLVQGNTVRDGGISVHTASRRVNVIGNYVEGGDNAGSISLLGGLSTASTEAARRSKDLVADGNTLVAAPGGDALNVNVTDGFRVTRNSILASAGTAVVVASSTDGFIDGNTIRDTGNHGIHVVTPRSYDLVISRNTIRDFTTYGVLVDTCDDVEVSHNHVFGGTKSIVSEAGTPLRHRYIGNRCEGSSSNSIECNAANTDILDNTVISSGSNSIWAAAAGAFVSGNRVTGGVRSFRFSNGGTLIGNTATGASSATLLLAAGTIARNNVLDGSFVADSNP